MRSIQLFIGMAALVISCACGTDKGPTTPTPTSTVSITGNLSYGSVPVGTTATLTLTIVNTGAAPLTVTGISFPPNYTGSFTSGTVAAGASQPVTVTFAPTAAQSYTGTITVTGNQANGSNTILVSGTGITIASFTLQGIVTETAPTTSTLLAGVRVTIVDGANQGKTATTGADGRYQIASVVNGGYTVSATLAGYRDVALPVGINGNTTLDFRLDPLAPRTSFGPGQYRVSTEIPAGRYYNDPANGCHFQRLRGFGGTSADVIVDSIINFDAAQWIVDVSPADAGFSTDANCGTWFTTPRRGLLTSIPPGLWIVGAQIAPGTYRADNSTSGCYWQRVTNFSGAIDATITSAFVSGSGAQLVTIASTDAGFSGNAECGTWSRQ